MQWLFTSDNNPCSTEAIEGFKISQSLRISKGKFLKLGRLYTKKTRSTWEKNRIVPGMLKLNVVVIA